MLLLLDSLCAPTHTTAAGATPTQQHVATALASGTLLSAGALSLLPAPANVVAPSALGPAISERRRTRTASLTATAAPLNGVLAPTTVVVEFAAALAVHLADVCNSNSLARGGVDFFISLTNNLLADDALLQQWARAVPPALPALDGSGFSLAAVAAAVHCVVVRQFARTFVTAWLRRNAATAPGSSLALRTSLRAGPSSSSAVSGSTASTATSAAPAAASSSSSASATAATSAASAVSAATTTPATAARAPNVATKRGKENADVGQRKRVSGSNK
jgi:hypothetical protein